MDRNDDPPSEEALRDLYGRPSELALAKERDRLDRWSRRFVELSPFLVLGTADAEGRQDASPRGDPPGFVRVLDDRTLLIPDRPGNRRIDSLRNVARHDRVALLFLVPGFLETLRVNGRARITTDRALLEGSAIARRVPASGLLVQVEEVFFHCGKAMIRSRLWDPGARADRALLPGLGRIVADQAGRGDGEAADARIDRAYREQLY